MDTVDKAAALTNAIDLLTEAVRATLVGREDNTRQAIENARLVLEVI